MTSSVRRPGTLESFALRLDTVGNKPFLGEYINVKAFLFLLIATICDFIGYYFLSVQNNLPAGILLFACSGPFFVLALRQRLSQGALYALWELFAAGMAVTVDFLFGGFVPSNWWLFFGGIALFAVVIYKANDVTKELGSITEEKDTKRYFLTSFGLGTFFFLLILFMDNVGALESLIALSPIAATILVAVAFTATDLGGLSVVVKLQPRKWWVAATVAFAFFLPSSIMYSLMIYKSEAAFIALSFLTGALAIFASFIFEQLDDGEVQLKDAAVITGLVLLAGVLLFQSGVSL